MSNGGNGGGSAAATFERDHFLRVAAMDEAGAKAFGMPDAVRAVYAGEADPTRYKFGARIYLLFQTWDDYDAWLREGGAS